MHKRWCSADILCTHQTYYIFTMHILHIQIYIHTTYDSLISKFTIQCVLFDASRCSGFFTRVRALSLSQSLAFFSFLSLSRILWVSSNLIYSLRKRATDLNAEEQPPIWHVHYETKEHHKKECQREKNTQLKLKWQNGEQFINNT